MFSSSLPPQKHEDYIYALFGCQESESTHDLSTGNIFVASKRISTPSEAPKITAEDMFAEGVAKRYRKAGREEGGRTVNGYCALAGYSRSYPGWALRQGPPKAERDKGAPARR